jgi:hypothetical protein
VTVITDLGGGSSSVMQYPGAEISLKFLRYEVVESPVLNTA